MPNIPRVCARPCAQVVIRNMILDCGAKQRDALSVDKKGSLDRYREVRTRGVSES